MNTTITPSHLADYLAFNTRRLMASLSFENDNSMHDRTAAAAARWRSISTILLMPVWRELDQYALDYVKQQWDSLSDDYAASMLMLIRDEPNQSDAELAMGEVTSIARNGKLIHRYREDGAIEVDRVSILLHRFGITDPRLEFGACVSDCRSNANAAGVQ